MRLLLKIFWQRLIRKHVLHAETVWKNVQKEALYLCHNIKAGLPNSSAFFEKWSRADEFTNGTYYQYT